MLGGAGRLGGSRGMKHVIVGTAGHIDHGKTTLVKALTGIDTDRWKEEKERGITIDLGFAYFDLPSGRRAGIVDVPGHERFIKNMLAGAGGIDIVVLVVAADEGIMPQTLEHLNILSLLETKQGIVALTKVDMVDPEWLELVLDDVHDRLQHTFLANAPVIPVSAVTRQGLDELVATIDRMTGEVGARDEHLPFRLPIDRVFSITGFGTVVTGTMIAGTITAGERAEVHPGSQETRIRSVQVHGKKVEQGFAGQRVAVNVTGLEVGDLKRGDVLGAQGLLSPTLMLDVRLQLLKDAEKPLENRERLRLYTGTSEVFCRAVLLDSELLMPGETALVQLRLEEPVAVLGGDRFVVRTYSPMYTVGGGTILDAHPKKRKRFKQEGLEELLRRESGGDIEILNQTLLQHSDEFPSEDELFRLAGRPAEGLTEALEQLQAEDVAVVLTIDGRSYYVHAEYLQKTGDRAQKALRDFHGRYPLRSGMPKEELRSRLSRHAQSKLFNSLLTLLAGEGRLVVRSGVVAAPDFQVEFRGANADLRCKVLEMLALDPFSPPDLAELAEQLREGPDRMNELVNALDNLGEVVKVSGDIALTADAFQQAKQKVVGTIRQKGSLTLADLRDALQTSRKYALPILEYLDAQRVTVRKGDVRVLHSQYSG